MEQKIRGKSADYGRFVRMFSSAIATQALLSAGNLLVSIALIRHATDEQYGYFVLVTNLILLLTLSQGSFIQPPMVLRLVPAGPGERADLVGGLLRDQRRLLLFAGAGLSIAVVAGWAAGRIGDGLALLLCASLTAASAALYRAFFRMVLLAYRLPHDVLKADLIYVVLLLLGTAIAVLTSHPVLVAILGSALAAVGGGVWLSRTLWRQAPWNPKAGAGVLYQMAPVGGWAAAGAASHWAFNQGSNYLVACVQDVASVSALAATRLLLTPIALLSTGIGSLMMPTATEWLNSYGPAVAYRRGALIASAAAGISLCYVIVIWFSRTWILQNLLHKNFAQSDALLVLWSVIHLIAVFRDPLRFLPGARGQFKHLCLATMATAAISIGCGYYWLNQIGIIGAPLAVLLGETLNALYVIYLSRRAIRSAARA